jgi:acetate kinase
VASGGRGDAARILTVNAGSTSLKLHLVTGDDAERVEDFASAPVDAVGHRVVHGGPELVDPVVVDERVTARLEQVTPLAPLHNAPALAALADARAALPDVPHVAVFDTAFHATMPAEASTYALPERWRAQWGIRRYGFHGLAVEWVASQVPVPRLVACHLGGGASVTAVLDGRSVDTTMGLTPLEGVPMATRSGSFDPGALLYVMREHGVSVAEADHVLHHESGLLALGGTGGVRDLLDAEQHGDARAVLALAVYVHRLAAAVAAMAAAMGGADVVAFSGGTGERSQVVRDRVMERVAFLGAEAMAVPSREELVIAAHVRAAVGG